MADTVDVESRLAQVFLRMYQADAGLRDAGQDPESFLLVHPGGMTREIDHSRWDASWPVPTADDIDDLADLGLLRTHPTQNAKRSFALTPEGRKQGQALTGTIEPPVIGGHPPNLNDTLRWLAEIEREEPACLDLPARLIERALSNGFIAPDARERFAQTVLDLMDDQYVVGMIPRAWQASAEQMLAAGSGLRLSMKAHAHLGLAPKPHDAGTLNFYGTVVAGQIAAGRHLELRHIR